MRNASGSFFATPLSNPLFFDYSSWFEDLQICNSYGWVERSRGKDEFEFKRSVTLLIGPIA